MIEVITSIPSDALPWPPLIRGTLIHRYKRFLVDVIMENGETVVAHCPNSGSMKGLIDKGNTVFLSNTEKVGRKTAYTLEMIQLPSTLVGVNTQLPNHLIRRAIQHNRIPELTGYDHLRSERRYGQNSRIDILLTDDKKPPCFIEIKNCTLVENKLAFFPDAVTTRGLKHLKELQEETAKGSRAVMFYLIQRMDAETFSPADAIDPAYGRELRNAVKNGVEILAWDVTLNPLYNQLRRPLPIKL